MPKEVTTFSTMLYRLPKGASLIASTDFNEFGFQIPEDRDTVFKTAELLEYIAERLRHKMARRT